MWQLNLARRFTELPALVDLMIPTALLRHNSHTAKIRHLTMRPIQLITTLRPNNTHQEQGGILDTLVVCQTRYIIVLRVTNLKCKETDTFHSRIMFYVFTKQSICITEFLSVVAVLCSVSACSMSHDGCVPKMSQLRSKDAPVVF